MISYFDFLVFAINKITKVKIKIMIIEYVQSLKRSNGEVEATVDQNISIPIKNLLNFADF